MARMFGRVDRAVALLMDDAHVSRTPRGQHALQDERRDGTMITCNTTITPRQARS
jgi:hypothetical protein